MLLIMIHRMGSFMLEFIHGKLDVNVDDERIDIAVEYGLDVNHEATADCRIAMSIRPKAQAEEAISGK